MHNIVLKKTARCHNRMEKAGIFQDILKDMLNFHQHLTLSHGLSALWMGE